MKNNIYNGEHYISGKFTELKASDIPTIIEKDRKNIMSFNLCKGYANVLIGSDELIDYIMDNLDLLREFQGKIFFKLNDYGSIIFDGIEIMWNRKN